MVKSRVKKGQKGSNGSKQEGQIQPSTQARFDEFWATYPRKRKKRQAMDIWKRKKLDRIADTLVADVRRRLAEDARWVAGYVPDPTTYLRGERWEDEIETPAPRVTAPRTNDDWIALGRQHGIHARPGEDWGSYIARLQQLLADR